MWRDPQMWSGSLAFTATAPLVAVVTAFAMVSAGSYTRAHGVAGHTHGTGGSGAHTRAVVPPKEYDPKKPTTAASSIPIIPSRSCTTRAVAGGCSSRRCS